MAAIDTDYDVVVVGAGPVGTALTWLLVKAGLRVCLLEAQPGPVTQLRASTFHPPTLDMLQPDGISGELISAGRITPSWQIRLHASGERVEFDLGVLADDTNYPYRLQCRQEVLVDSCLRRIAHRQPGAVHFSSSLTSIIQESDLVRASYDAAGSQQTVTARWLVGCDGPRSTVRNTLGISFLGDAYPESTILATTRFAFEEHLPDLSGVNYIWGEGETFSLLRLPDVWRCSFHPRAGQTPEAALATMSIHAHLAAVVAAAGEAHIEERRIYQVHHRVAERYREQRVFLAGDAAHLNSPKGGMGMNGGIHDAFELAGILTTVDHDDPEQNLLDRYERRRRPVAVEDIIGQSDQNRARMAIKDNRARLERLQQLQRIAADRDQARHFLLRSSMIHGLQQSKRQP